MKYTPSTEAGICLTSFVPSRRALLVDDVPYNLELLAAMLRPLGFDSSYASNIDEAKRAIRHVSFDVVFLDCELPDGFGFSLAAEIDQMDLEQKPTIISMTASDDETMQLRCFSAGVDGFIAKPLTFEAVCENLCKCELIDGDKTYEEPPRPKLTFKSLQYMAQGDDGCYLRYLLDLQDQLEAELFAFASACEKEDAEEARKVLHRLLSLTPLVESKVFTSAVQSAQCAAREKNIVQLRQLVLAVDLEYKAIKTSLRDELCRWHKGQTPSLRKSA